MSIHLNIIRAAALLAPSEQRAEWFAEWRSELWHVSHSQLGKAGTISFCVGAFKDALWLRRNCPSPHPWKIPRFDSPFECGLFLAVLAAVSLFFAFRLPGPRDAILPSPYRDAASLVMIFASGRSNASLPSIPIEQYHSLANHAPDLFTGFAFYQLVPPKVHVARRTVELSIALSSSNLFELLGITGERQHGAALILNRTTWRKYFDSDPHLTGHVVEVGGQRARIAGVIPAESWRLPGRIDAWLLPADDSLPAMPQHSKGYVLAHVKASPLHPKWARWWRISVPNEQGGYDAFECASLARRQSIFAHLLMIVLAVLILPATTSLRLGEYPSHSRRTPWATRARRWIFLGIKFALIVPIVFCGTLDLAPIIASGSIQPHAMLAGYVLAFRWALIDQRARCPMCLRLLTNPTRIGQPSQTFLEWYGVEFICAKGHGLLHVPEIPTSCYSTQRWIYLDRSWSSLFLSVEAEHAASGPTRPRGI